jgi:hypothetical protein
MSGTAKLLKNLALSPVSKNYPCGIVCKGIMSTSLIYYIKKWYKKNKCSKEGKEGERKSRKVVEREREQRGGEKEGEGEAREGGEGAERWRGGERGEKSGSFN